MISDEMVTELVSVMSMFHHKDKQRGMSDNLQGEPMVLAYIMHHEGPITPSAISRGTRMTNARVAAVLGVLEKKGLISRSVDEKDKRRFLICLTEQGKEFAREKKRELFSDTRNLLEFLGEEDGRELIRLMKRIQEWTPPCQKSL